MSVPVGVGVQKLWPINRLRYFYDELLHGTDFVDEQNFHLGEMGFRAALLRLAGLNDGFQVTIPNQPPFTLQVSAGSGFDVNGSLIVLTPPAAGVQKPLSAGSTGWVAAQNGWQRTFDGSEIGNASIVSLYVQYGETQFVTGIGSTPNNIQQTPLMDIRDASLPLPAGALLVAVMWLTSSGFTKVADYGKCGARAWSGLVMSTPAPNAGAPPPASSSSSSSLLSSSSSASGSGGGALLSDAYFVRSAPLDESAAKQLQVGGANRVLAGVLSPSGGVDPNQSTLSLSADHNALITTPKLVMNGVSIQAIDTLAIGPQGAPVLLANDDGVTIDGDLYAANTALHVDTTKQQIMIGAPLSFTQAVTWAPTATIAVTSPLSVFQQMIGLGAVGNVDDGISWNSAVSQLQIAGHDGVVLAVAGVTAPPQLTITSAAGVTLNSATVSATILSAAGGGKVAGNLQLTATSQVMSSQWNLNPLPMNSWTQPGDGTSVATATFTAGGGTVTFTLSGAVMSQQTSMPSGATTIAVAVDGKQLFEMSVLPATMQPGSSSVSGSSSSSSGPALTTYWWVVAPMTESLVPSVGQHTVTVTIQDKVQSSALLVTAIEQPLVTV